ncbi:unnamed protein product [Chrysoparadoxa australica]
MRISSSLLSRPLSSAGRCSCRPVALAAIHESSGAPQPSLDGNDDTHAAGLLRGEYEEAMKAAQRSRSWKRVSDLLREMKKKGIKPSAFCYRVAIAAAEQQQHEKGRDVMALRLLKEMKSARLSPGVWAYSSVVASLTKAKRHRESLSVFDEVMQGVRKQLGRYPLSTDSRVSLVKIYGFAITSAAALGLRQRACDALKEMEELGVKPNLIHHNSAMSACNKAEEWKMTLQLFDSLSTRQQLRPDAFSYAAAITAHGGLLQWEQALQLLKHGSGDGRASVAATSLVCYNSCITAVGKAGQWAAAVELLKEMAESCTGQLDSGSRAPHPDVRSYVCTMGACNSAKRWQESLAVWSSFNRGFGRGRGINGRGFVAPALGPSGSLSLPEVQGVRANVHAYGALLQAYAIGRRWREAVLCLTAMRKRGVRPNSYCYTAAISACGRCGRWEEALMVLEDDMGHRMKQTVEAYTAAIGACAESPPEGQKMAFGLLMRMVSEGLQPSGLTFAAVIRCASPEDALAILESLKANKVELTEPILSEVIRRQDPATALQLLRGMAKNRLTPGVMAFTAAIDAHARSDELGGAMSLYEEMKEAGGRNAPSVHTFNTLIALAARVNRSKTSFYLLQEMKSAGVRMNTDSYVAAVEACRSDWLNATAFLEAAPKPTLKLYAATLNVLIEAGQVDLAQLLLRDAAESGMVDVTGLALEHGIDIDVLAMDND